MESVSDARLLGYALLATAVTFGIWATWFTSTGGGWIFVGAIIAFALLAFVDGVVGGRIRQRGESGRRESGDRQEHGDGDPSA